MDDLDRAIETNKQVVESTPVGHPSQALFLSSLGSALQNRFEDGIDGGSESCD